MLPNDGGENGDAASSTAHMAVQGHPPVEAGQVRRVRTLRGDQADVFDAVAVEPLVGTKHGGQRVAVSAVESVGEGVEWHGRRAGSARRSSWYRHGLFGVPSRGEPSRTVQDGGHGHALGRITWRGACQRTGLARPSRSCGNQSGGWPCRQGPATGRQPVCVSLARHWCARAPAAGVPTRRGLSGGCLHPP
jgi:hypothetical protein